jgi:hypothetical protein
MELISMLNKTPKGAEVLQTRGVNLPPRQRTLLLLANGTRSNQELLKQTAGLSATQSDLDALCEAGLLHEPLAAYNADPMPLPPQIVAPVAAEGNYELNDLRDAAFQVRDGAAPSIQRSTQSAPPQSRQHTVPMSVPLEPLPPMTEAERFEQAYRTATKLSSELGLRAFRLQLSLERSSNLDEIRALRAKLLEALVKESGESEGYKRIRPLDRLLRS